MSFLDLFKSSKEREREKRRAQRAKERRAERGIRHLESLAKGMEREKASLWSKARELLQSGQKDEAARVLRQYKLLCVQLESLEQQKMLSQNKLTRVEAAGEIGGITAAIADVADGAGVDPDEISDNFDRISDVEEDADEVDTIVQDEIRKDLEKAMEKTEGQESLPDDDELMSALESEAAAEVLGPKVAEDANAVQGGINEGRDKLRKLLDDEQQ
ncbi:MAG: hypothetical protein IJS15_08165 [Victivallales bacterium]|nr:hypothetical protein [Victivallales bacterium]